jgi:hypothetical protein
VCAEGGVARGVGPGIPNDGGTAVNEVVSDGDRLGLSTRSMLC